MRLTADEWERVSSALSRICDAAGSCTMCPLSRRRRDTGGMRLECLYEVLREKVAPEKGETK